jgi:hypothetical protein
MNSDNEISNILSLGRSKIFMIDPQQKHLAVKSTIDALVRDSRSHLAKMKKIYLVLIKE